MKVTFCSVGEYGVYDSMNLRVATFKTIHEALQFIYDNWVENEDFYSQVVDEATGEVICFAHDGDFVPTKEKDKLPCEAFISDEGCALHQDCCNCLLSWL